MYYNWNVGLPMIEFDTLLENKGKWWILRLFCWNVFEAWFFVLNEQPKAAENLLPIIVELIKRYLPNRKPIYIAENTLLLPDVHKIHSLQKLLKIQKIKADYFPDIHEPCDIEEGKALHFERIEIAELLFDIMFEVHCTIFKHVHFCILPYVSYVNRHRWTCLNI